MTDAHATDASKPDADGVPVLVERVARRKPTTPIEALVPPKPKPKPPVDDGVQPKPQARSGTSSEPETRI